MLIENKNFMVIHIYEVLFFFGIIRQTNLSSKHKIAFKYSFRITYTKCHETESMIYQHNLPLSHRFDWKMSILFIKSLPS